MLTTCWSKTKIIVYSFQTWMWSASGFVVQQDAAEMSVGEVNSPILLLRPPKPPGVSVLGASPLEGEQSQLHRNKVPFVLSTKLLVVLEIKFVEMHIICFTWIHGMVWFCLHVRNWLLVVCHWTWKVMYHGVGKYGLLVASFGSAHVHVLLWCIIWL